MDFTAQSNLNNVNEESFIDSWNYDVIDACFATHWCTAARVWPPPSCAWCRGCRG